MKTAIRIGNYICVFLLLAILVTQFVPFWNCSDCKTHKEEDRSVSIVEYTWFPEHHKPITKNMTDAYLAEYGADYKDENGDKYKFAVDDIIVRCAIVLFSGVLGAVLCLIFSKRAFVMVFPFICGAAGSIGYLTSPAMSSGTGYGFHVILFSLVAVVALAGMIAGSINWIKRRGRYYSLVPVLKFVQTKISGIEKS